MSQRAVIHFDGGAQPNPGPAAIGAVIETDDDCIEHRREIGEATNNQAEYTALIKALEKSLDAGYNNVEVYGDSQLIVRQVKGEWQTKDPELRSKLDRVKELTDEFEEFQIEHIPREKNKQADELVDKTLR
jgi:ribonuclease HI